MSKAKRNREEKQAQDIMNQIKEDKAKERAHREAVRQQIARDKAEREARRQNELQERQRAQASVAPSAAVSGGSDRQPRTEWLVMCVRVPFLYYYQGLVWKNLHWLPIKERLIF